VQFWVLGVVEADGADHQVVLGHTRQRCLLAVLLVEANRVVSVDQLMARVWGDHPPQRGRGVLYSYLSRLRKIFADQPDVVIERRSGGYRLTVDQASVDLHRFRGLIDQARRADEDARALMLFDQAFRLWRGTPFTDLDTPWLASVRATLETERHAAQLDRTDVALRSGQHAQLLVDLSAQAAQHPFDERIAGQLMLALAGSGRQAEALTIYQHTRRALVDELGLEPGLELRHLHERILTGDAHGYAPAPAEVTSPGVQVPRQLPPPAWHFTGRQTELDALAGLLTSTDRLAGTVVISAINGMVGIGKAALAVHAAHQLADRFTDGVLFADLHGFTPDAQPSPPELVLDRLLRGLGGSRTADPP
jgi:DNA-binding SARP family transcriptional activator